MITTELDLRYLVGVLTDRKQWLVNEMRRCVIDKVTPLSTIKSFEGELVTLEKQLNLLKKENT